jgi:hypothetical protein
MINKENANKPLPTVPTKESGYVDTAKIAVYGHILIKDKDTGEILVNKRA